jgi:hypothetical protein
VCRKDPRRNHAQYNREGNTTIPASTADILGEDMPHKIIIITAEYRQSANLILQSSELGLYMYFVIKIDQKCNFRNEVYGEPLFYYSFILIKFCVKIDKLYLFL